MYHYFLLLSIFTSSILKTFAPFVPSVSNANACLLVIFEILCRCWQTDKTVGDQSLVLCRSSTHSIVNISNLNHSEDQYPSVTYNRLLFFGDGDTSLPTVFDHINLVYLC